MLYRRAGSSFRPMRTTFAKAAAGLALAGLVCSDLGASTPVPALDAEKVERLCPLAGGIGPLAGRLGEILPFSELGPHAKLGPAFAPFAFAETELTNWSRRFYALTYRAAHDGTTDLAVWQDGVIRSLTAAGWQALPEGDPLKRRTYDNPVMVKLLGAPTAQRRMVVEIEASGAFMLRCGDFDLTRLDSDEEEERLAPGSPRPILQPLQGAASLPEPSVCETKEWRDAFAAVESLGELGPVLIARLPAGLPAPDLAGQAKRLNTWLHWTMIESGKFDQDAVWQIEAEAAEPQDVDTEFRKFVTEVASVFDAGQRTDPVVRCRTMLSFAASQIASDRKEALRIGKVNAALEKAARARGVAID